MRREFAALPRGEITVEARASQGPHEWWRAALGHGGIHPSPLPERVVDGVARLRPRRVRIFIQEFFHVYPGDGRFEWDRLDAYLDAFARTGAEVVAALCIKPRALFPRIDHAVWQPTDAAEWRRVICEIVRRYSVSRRWVTHWEIGNEPDIGESGGTPYLIPDPDAYFEFYRTAVAAVRETAPAARVGGPAACWAENEPLPGLLRRCSESGVPLDFISWHVYSDDPRRHVAGVERARALVRATSIQPELFVTEWSCGFGRVSVEEMAFDPRRAASVAASLLAMHNAGVDWTFYYHIWDQVCERRHFEPFFSPAGVRGMLVHWNEAPHRFGLFGVNEEVRPQYFVYQLIGRLGEERLQAHSDLPDVRAIAARGDGRVAVLAVNFDLHASRDLILTLRFEELRAGKKRLTVYRIDADRRWCSEGLALRPTEQREVDTGERFRCQIYSPADSVACAVLSDLD